MAANLEEREPFHLNFTFYWLAEFPTTSIFSPSCRRKPHAIGAMMAHTGLGVVLADESYGVAPYPSPDS